MSAVVNIRPESNLPHALRYAVRGWSVLPVDPKTKRPLIQKWEQAATCEPSTIRGWWAAHPGAAIGVHSGKSGVVVVDVDPRNGGDKTLASIEGRIGELWLLYPLIARTGGGGKHFVFRAPGDPASLPAKLGDGIDLLRGNRYFIVAPSLHPSGNAYEWEPGGGPFDAGAWDNVPELPGDLLALNDHSEGAAATSASEGLSQPGTELREVDGAALMWRNPIEDEDPAKIALVRAALKKISPDGSRDDYLTVLTALHSTGWEDAHDIAEEWASGSIEDKFNERHFRSDWHSLKIERHGKLRTLGSLFELAKQAGWVDPRTKPGTAQADTFGDISNGRRFAEQFRGVFLYVAASKRWVMWDGRRWLACSAGQEMRAARKVIELALDDAHAAYKSDPTERNRSNHGHALAAHRNVRKQEALLTVAATEEGMSVASDAVFDANPWHLNVRNGVVDLRLGALLQPCPEMLVSRQCGASFDRGAACPQWLAFLDSVFSGDAELIGFIQRAVGYSLTGSVDEEVLFFLYGIGANGKSVFANVLNAVFGDYAVTVRAAMLARDPKGNGSDAEREKVQLPGARIALINEVGAGDVMDDQRIKELVSREDISARHLYGESFSFTPTHKLWIRGNHQPGALDTTDGFWRRIILVGFTRQFAEHERVADLDKRIIDSERDGVLMWALEGCLEWRRGGLRIPAAIRKATAQYRTDTDLMGEWIDGWCRVDPRSETQSNELFRSYCAFLRDANMKAPSQPVFTRQITQRPGLTKRRSNGHTLIKGLALSDGMTTPAADDGGL